MCRIAAFPPFFSREKAIDILRFMEGRNTDGVGMVYVKPDGTFMLQRNPKSLSWLLPRDPSFLGHMPYDGWTVCHLRLATHGRASVENTHPFIVGDWAVAHNGIWMGHDLIREVLEKSVKFQGETDSEVAAHAINIVGPKRFSEIASGGVYVCLKRDGSLWVSKTCGYIEEAVIDAKKVLSSTLSVKWGWTRILQNGWYNYAKNGVLEASSSPPVVDVKESPFKKYASVVAKRFGANVIDFREGRPGNYASLPKHPPLPGSGMTASQVAARITQTVLP